MCDAGIYERGITGTGTESGAVSRVNDYMRVG